MTTTTEKSNSVSSTRTPAILVLADGRVFRGRAFGAQGTTLGEAVFTTAMTGYQETMTDPSYHRQIVVSTAPQIGNTGWNDEDGESHGDRIWVAGLVIRDLSRTVSNWRADRSLAEEMEAQGIIGIQGVDTRAIVRHLRDKGSVKAGIFSGPDAERPVEELVAAVDGQPSMAGADLATEVSTDDVYVVEPDNGEDAKFTVIAYDMGIKTNTPRNFAVRGIRTVVVPANSAIEPLLTEYDADGVFISNGPGDPATADVMVQQVQTVLEKKIPLFGICFGNQILGRALGMDTYKLKFGHRGINVPVINHLTGVIDITAQNHGFALKGRAGEPFDTPFGTAQVTHTCLNDDCVEGVALDNGLAFSVQYHPEAAAGPHDANPLFDQFIELMEGNN
ncbi:glutamine-hydrolyzing carbamoyl-phosphate synthase small subunit [Corynebacterium variabile]|uniref:Carbamoyl phosphate synthase small chain n=2 Tax=Corynebacterium variabile TaxID=1727 RepID=A0A0X2NM28_9CORY|nr:glutamine-hydrolyzing carbamoyl-phosphate synthase small subunit [Corynebacterium variabile]AEK36860.1 carbamoyl-phosphate synthase small chain [Corynebacterium variabile DSM 44702]MDN6239761.1 glutamine-hydrolyzing carbamoyl-phosphate synthase small subunit [Corynebacterium variabile]MDN6478274.1 glutamine-hydrolyzing carbamoyl-phosphate synthase small subunit [Corynebacterium variabile]MDN6675281.1 glutamine-hydrolyzing carbamoyl-phosphate synthase small subunit [Corynebacterium variabile]